MIRIFLYTLLAISIKFSPLVSAADEKYSQPSLDKIDPKKYNLPENYKDFYRINPNNFESRVLKTEETWIILFTKQEGFNFKLDWKKLAKKHRGGILFGVVDMQKYKLFGEDRLAKINKKMDAAEDAIEIAVMYRGPAKPEYVPNPTKAVRMASRFEPATSVRHFKPNEPEAMYKYVVPAFYHSKPYPRFPIVMIYDDKEPIPWVLKYLQNHKLFNVYYDFRCLKSSDFIHLKKMFRDVAEPTTYPNYLALVGKEPENVTGDLDMTFDIVQFVEKKFGPATSFSAVSGFLFWLNDEYRHVLPGRKFPDNNEIMRPLADALNKRLESILGSKPVSAKPTEAPKKKLVREEL